MPAKYQPLGAYLAGLPADVTHITLTLTEIAAIVGASLPPSARSRTFWTNARSARGGIVQTRAWRQAGWRIGTFDYRAATVTFTRVDAAGEPAARSG
jgi:hypothetical protein